MKHMMMIAVAACVAIFTGCKSIEVERKAQSIATIKNADGTVEVLRDAAGNPVVLDGGWEVDYFQHWNWQEFASLSAKAGTAELVVGNYRGGADATNLTQLVNTSLDGLTKLTVAVGEAYVKIAGGGAQADTALKSASKIINYFRNKGGDVDKATVSTDDGKVKVDDGSVCIQCDEAGNCTDCSAVSTK